MSKKCAWNDCYACHWSSRLAFNMESHNSRKIPRRQQRSSLGCTRRGRSSRTSSSPASRTNRTRSSRAKWRELEEESRVPRHRRSLPSWKSSSCGFGSESQETAENVLAESVPSPVGEEEVVNGETRLVLAERLDETCYTLFRMIAGAGVGMHGSGAGMLRARRRDISIKPNRKLDKKSSRGMIYENEELRLRTIHINAEVEQGQNDIKKLRRENEQLRREIWSLRDEYDKLEEILKKQKSREESDEPEGRSEDEAAGSEYSEDDEEEDEEEDNDDDESESDDETDEKHHDQDERLENAENQKISSEKMNNSTTTQHRTRLNFDGLSVVDEEEEPKKDKDKKDGCSSSEQLPRVDPVQQQLAATQQNHFPYHTTSFEQTDPLTTTSFGYQTDCPFVFPSSAAEGTSGYSNIVPMDGSCLLMTTCRPQLYPSSTSQQPVIPLATLAPPALNSSLDISMHNRPRPPLAVTPPPPPGWQSNVSMLPAGGNPIAPTNFPPVARTQSPTRDSRLASSKDLPLKPPEDIARAVENGQTIVSTQHSKLTNISSLAERRKAFFKQHADNFRASGLRRNPDNGGTLDTPDKASRNCDSEVKSRLEKSIDDRDTMKGENGGPDPSTIDNRPRHFFAPLQAKSRFPHNGENSIRSIDDSTTRQSDNGNSPSSEKTVCTVISRGAYNCEKGSADIYVNGAIPCHGGGQIEKGDAKAFFSSENLLIIGDSRNNESSNSSSNLFMKSVSCQDLSSRLSFTDNLKSTNNDQHAKSDNTLDTISICSKAFKSQLNVTLRQPGSSRKSLSPDTPEIPKLPSIDYKLFNNPFLQNFEQAYQNFPVRTEGQSPVTHPLSIQVCESPVSGPGYSSPIRMQPSFTGPSTTEPDCGTCKRKDLERLRLMIPSSKLLDQNGDRQEFHVTSFETPSPHTLQIPPMTPYELEALRKMPTGTSPVPPTSRLYQNVPFVPRGAAVYCPGQGMRMYYDTTSMKVPAQTQTSPDDEAKTQVEGETKITTTSTDNNQPSPDQLKKRRSRKEKSGSIKEKRRSPSSQRRKDTLKKQTSITSKDIPESPGRVSIKTRASETQDDKNESRSSSSGQESPRKDQTKRVSLHFSTKKRPSLSSVRTSRSRSVENAKERQLTRGEAFEGNATNSERERTNSISSREAGVREKARKGSTSSGSVPWCACWGNGCI